MKKFTYGIGASWVLELRGYAGVRRLVQFTVKDCRLKRGVEYYDVEQREQGKEVQQIEDMSASRLHYLINLYRKTVQRPSGGLSAHARGSDGVLQDAHGGQGTSLQTGALRLASVESLPGNAAKETQRGDPGGESGGGRGRIARGHDHRPDPQPYGASGRDQSGVRYQRRGSDNGVRLPDLQRPRRAWERRDLRMCESA